MGDHVFDLVKLPPLNDLLQYILLPKAVLRGESNLHFLRLVVLERAHSIGVWSTNLPIVVSQFLLLLEPIDHLDCLSTDFSVRVAVDAKPVSNLLSKRCI